MRNSKKSKLILLTALIIIGAILLAGTTAAYAASEPEANASPPEDTLSVDEVWLTGDLLHITVTDKNSGKSQSIKLNLSDYAKPGDEYVTVQATDEEGRTSSSVQFKNPYYAKNPGSDSSGAVSQQSGSESKSKVSGDDSHVNKSAAPDSNRHIDTSMVDDGVSHSNNAATSDGNNLTDDGNNLTEGVSLFKPDMPATGESAIPDNSDSAGDSRPFTHKGAGTVVDNATGGDGKEFFNVETPDGNVFYLIVDRQRNTDNVYLLNAVTEDDLASLAKPGNGKSVSAIETPETAPITPPEQPKEQTVAPEAQQSGGSKTGATVFILIAVIGIGGAGYYFKIVRPKKLRASDDDDYDDEPENFNNEQIEVNNNEEEEEGENYR
jgi:hypothetical protein